MLSTRPAAQSLSRVNGSGACPRAMQRGLGFRQELEELSHRVMLQKLGAERLLRDHAVEDTAALPARGDVTGVAQVAEYQRNPTLAELEPLGHVADTEPWFVLDGKQKPTVVGQQRPIGQVELSFRLVEPVRCLTDDTGSPLQRTKVAALWGGFEGGVLRLTDH